jgi:hypothetical protein
MPQKGLEKSMPQLPRGCFKADLFLNCTRPCIASADVKLQPEGVSQFADELFVIIRIRSANPMVKMSDAEHGAEFFAEFQQNPQEPNGVCPAGDGDGDTITGLHEFALANVACDTLG